ncbi:ABC transporter ATP-binding protein [Streptomyces sp. Root1310]|uniref:ABC transporter ATP-binding protein n=1 Tax=Streptomyces sp. Root1310 TaxID=1736452 RepID=UPI0007104F3F|nr:ABC transporter ATP-binding protein [Streptomyces sp. Root1310]KQX67533.1 ABC transporter ATP-binding protein [Streptomyces sp. Root1310]
MAMDRTTGELLRAATRHSGARCVALGLVNVTATAAQLLLPAALGRALDLLLTHSPATRWVLSCAALALLLTLLDACETVLTGTLDARTTAFLRRRVTGHVLAVGPRATARFGAGDLVARVVGSAAQAGTAPGARAALLAAPAGPVGAVAALALIDPWLAVVFLTGAPVLTLLLRSLARGTSACVADYQRAQGRIADALTEAVAGARTIRAAGTADRDTARILRPLPELSRAGRRMWQVQGRAAAQATAVAPLLHLAVVAVAGLLLTRHRLSAGDVLAASRYAVLATGVGVLVGQLSGLVRSRTAAARLGEVLTEPAPPYGDRRLPREGPGRLELRGVTARRGDRTVLDGVDLVVPGGTTLALVGRSGTGKSLLAALAGRLADPDGGEVLLDGVPLPALPRAELRAAIAQAFDRPALLGTTIEDTVSLGLASPARVREAARTACAEDFVRRLPDGYATPCADAPHSGGEAQRLGLARAFAHGGRLLILDDALSSLDTITERQVTRSVFGSTTSATRLVVAHRASTAARADTVAWLDGGRVRAVGTHEQLWRTAGYRAVFGTDGETEEAAGAGTPAGAAANAWADARAEARAETQAEAGSGPEARR